MPSRVRVMLRYSGREYYDRKAIQQLEQQKHKAMKYFLDDGKPVETFRWKRAIQLYQGLAYKWFPAVDPSTRLKVWRERRGVRLRRSEVVKKAKKKAMPARLGVAPAPPRRWREIDGDVAPLPLMAGNNGIVQEAQQIQWMNAPQQAAQPQPQQRPDGLGQDFWARMARIREEI